MLMRYWYVPEYSANVEDVPEILSKFMISFEKKIVTDARTGRIEGYVFKFRCVPGLYSILKAWCKSGNNLAPLEVKTAK